MEKPFYVRYKNQSDDNAHVAIAETPLDAAKWLYYHYPANMKRSFPIIVRWYEGKIEQKQVVTLEDITG